MSLSVTGSSVFLGQGLVGGDGIEFIPTDMDAVDASGKPTGRKLLIAKTPLINDHRSRINAHLLDRDLTYGSMALHEDGTAYVVGHGSEQESQRVPRNLVMDAGHDMGTMMSVKHGIQFVDGLLILAGPDFATHPAVHMNWYESASQAAALEDAVQEWFPGMRIRMMRGPEVDRFLTWDGKYTEEGVKAWAHLHRDGVKGTASVVGDAAASRTTDEGFVDVFGNVSIWTDSVFGGRPITGADVDRVPRMLFSEYWGISPSRAYFLKHFGHLPNNQSWRFGARFVAVPNQQIKP